MNSTMVTIFGLLGGLALFLYGMNMMSECLQKAAGEKMKNILALLTKNPVMGVLAGALTTAVLQSSSATTVMAIGFVSAGLMNLPQAISIIFGANIGTTMTAQIIAFNISDYIYIIIFLGFIVAFVTKNNQVKNIAQSVFSFGLLFLGIETMGSVMEPLASSPIFVQMIEKVSGIPILGVLVGTIMTLVVQSSSATIAVLQNFASQPMADGVTSIIGLAGAIPILLGDNIGTTITALLASIGQSKDAKRTALAHCIFNLTGTCLFIWFIGPFAKIIQWISPKGAEIEVISRQIANAHTTFNIVMTIIWTPLIWLMVKIVMKLIKDDKQTTVDEFATMFLDQNLIAQPTVALELAAREVLHLSEVLGEMIQAVSQAAQTEQTVYIQEVLRKSRVVKTINEKITQYFSDMFAAGVLTEEQAEKTAGMMQVLGDIERTAVLCRMVADSIYEKIEKKAKYSKDAMKDLQKSLQIMEELYQEVLIVLQQGDLENGKKIQKKKEKIMELDIAVRKAHMKRVKAGKCAPELTAPFHTMLQNIERMGNACANMADIALGRVDFTYFLNRSNNH